ncbi:MAG: lipid-A-disaccharide synthase [Puniceicoccales bacterium]|jgi:lipid-A-disaccharide synthase|nr:lipid-A-disaccharide synthase [Puniceicoccales bacterium]
MTASIPAQFPPPPGGRVDILLVAGEHSGDEHAARIVSTILRHRPDLRISALGGPALRDAGAQLLFDMTTSSAVGLVEVLAHLPFYRKVFLRALDWVRAHRPRLVCLVDYPGFNLRFAERLRACGLSRQGGGGVSVCYYVSPQIWAWKSRRRFRMARCLDGLGTIFPFEPDCYADTTLPVRYVGHPFATPPLRPAFRYDRDAPVLLLPGSRPKAVCKIFPILLDTWARFLPSHPARTACVIHPGDPVESLLREQLSRMPKTLADTITLLPRSAPMPLPASAAIGSSGTMSLKTALAGIPGAIVYRANPLTWWFGRRLVRGVSYLGIANILLRRPAWPEFLQTDADPDLLAARLHTCLASPETALAAQNDAAELHELLAPPSATGTPADWLLENLP